MDQRFTIIDQTARHGYENDDNCRVCGDVFLADNCKMELNTKFHDNRVNHTLYIYQRSVATKRTRKQRGEPERQPNPLYYNALFRGNGCGAPRVFQELDCKSVLTLLVLYRSTEVQSIEQTLKLLTQSCGDLKDTRISFIRRRIYCALNNEFLALLDPTAECDGYEIRGIVKINTHYMHIYNKMKQFLQQQNFTNEYHVVAPLNLNTSRILDHLFVAQDTLKCKNISNAYYEQAVLTQSIAAHIPEHYYKTLIKKKRLCSGRKRRGTTWHTKKIIQEKNKNSRETINAYNHITNYVMGEVNLTTSQNVILSRSVRSDLINDNDVVHGMPNFMCHYPQYRKIISQLYSIISIYVVSNREGILNSKVKTDTRNFSLERSIRKIIVVDHTYKSVQIFQLEGSCLKPQIKKIFEKFKHFVGSIVVDSEKELLVKFFQHFSTSMLYIQSGEPHYFILANADWNELSLYLLERLIMLKEMTAANLSYFGHCGKQGKIVPNRAAIPLALLLDKDNPSQKLLPKGLFFWPAKSNVYAYWHVTRNDQKLSQNILEQNTTRGANSKLTSIFNVLGFEYQHSQYGKMTFLTGNAIVDHILDQYGNLECLLRQNIHIADQQAFYSRCSLVEYANLTTTERMELFLFHFYLHQNVLLLSQAKPLSFSIPCRKTEHWINAMKQIYKNKTATSDEHIKRFINTTTTTYSGIMLQETWNNEKKAGGKTNPFHSINWDWGTNFFKCLYQNDASMAEKISSGYVFKNAYLLDINGAFRAIGINLKLNFGTVSVLAGIEILNINSRYENLKLFEHTKFFILTGPNASKNSNNSGGKYCLNGNNLAELCPHALYLVLVDDAWYNRLNGTSSYFGPYGPPTISKIATQIDLAITELKTENEEERLKYIKMYKNMFNTLIGNLANTSCQYSCPSLLFAYHYFTGLLLQVATSEKLIGYFQMKEREGELNDDHEELDRHIQGLTSGQIDFFTFSNILVHEGWNLNGKILAYTFDGFILDGGDMKKDFGNRYALFLNTIFKKLSNHKHSRPLTIKCQHFFDRLLLIDSSKYIAEKFGNTRKSTFYMRGLGCDNGMLEDISDAQLSRPAPYILLKKNLYIWLHWELCWRQFVSSVDTCFLKDECKNQMDQFMLHLKNPWNFKTLFRILAFHTKFVNYFTHQSVPYDGNDLTLNERRVLNQCRTELLERLKKCENDKQLQELINSEVRYR